MLVEFRVKNFRSIRDEQVLSLVASKDQTLRDGNTVATDVSAVPSLLASTVVYGANASGKSNLIKALQFMRGVVFESAGLQPGQTFLVQPFLLDGESADQPTEFELTFLIDKVRYQYGFSLTSQRIISEHLLVYKAFKPQRWFERHYDSNTNQDQYEFGASLKGQKNVWEGVTRANALFLSMAVQLNSEQLRPVFDWLINRLVIFNEVSPLNTLQNQQMTVQMLVDKGGKKIVCDFLTSADINVADIEVVSRKEPWQTAHVDFGEGKSEIRHEEVEVNELYFHHATEHGNAKFGLAEESSGTRKLLFLSGPIFNILSKGQILVIDELETSLHPLLVKRLVELFHNPEFNTGGAQLVFTTHDTSLLNAPDLLRRDQVWFVEKNSEQASTLYSLSDFSPRKNEALERGYLMGRYGGLPFFSDWTRVH